MHEQLQRIKESIVYYVKQNKRLAFDNSSRKNTADIEKNKQHIRENEKRIEKLKNYYAQVFSQLKQEENRKNT